MDLISMHIRKTAGISFRKILTDLYGAELAVEYPGILEQPVTEKTRVIHGHFPVKKYLEKFPNARCITWVREPISRLRSQYLFWKYHGRKQGSKGGTEFMQSIIDGRMSFLEFATHASMRDTYRYFFDGVPLSRFFFIGIYEQFNSDVEKLIALLDWRRDIKIPVWNKTEVNINPDDIDGMTEFRTLALNEQETKAVRDAQKEDIALYDEVLRLRCNGSD